MVILLLDFSYNVCIFASLIHSITLKNFTKMETIKHNVKAFDFINKLSPELRGAIVSIADDLRPLLDEIHSNAPTTQNYYGDYLRLMTAYKPERAKIIGLALLYAGANVQGLQAASKLI